MQRQFEQRMGEMTQVVIARTGELQQAHDDSEQLLNAISSLLIEVDSELRVRRWNQRAETMFSISVAEAMGVRFADLPISWVDAAQAETLVNCETSNGDTHVEIEFRDANEMHRVIGVSTHQIEAHGVVQGSLLLGVDLTDQRSLERQLQAGQKLEAIGQLAAGVAHEINTPLQYVGDNLQYLKSSFEKVLAPLEVCLRLLSSEQDDIVLGDVMSELSGSMQSRKLKSLLEQVPEALEDSAEGLRTVSRIVRAMKEFSHPGTEDKSPVDVNHALETTLTVSANEWKYVTTVDTDFDPDLTTVPAFPGELNQVFLNLIVNGAHAIADCVGSDGSEKGKIIVATKAGVDYVEVRISDSGSGIPEHIQNRVFDPFFTTKEVGKGTGQGLAIAYDVIVKKHGGKLWFETTAGEGTSFFIELPSIDPTEMAAEADSMEAEPVESSV